MKKYPIIKGIPSFIENEKIYGGGQGQFNQLFKGKGIEEKNLLIKLYNKISCSQNRISFIKKHLKKYSGSKILDIGCGGGGLACLYKKYSNILIGLDIALDSLINAKQSNLYDFLIHASIENNPFHNNYFDVIVSSDVLGHTFLETKEKAYHEMWRILKPKGVMIHVIETDSTSFWIRIAKKNPQLYKTNHIEKYGHIGMELPSIIIKRCKDIGFDIIDTSKINAIILPSEVIISWFDGEFDRSFFINLLLYFSKIICSKKYINYLTNFILGIIEKPLNKIIPIDWTTGLLLCAQKK
jgi:ubiquinone/menaquinone biosynthesis C-methylase UbiE